VDGKALKQLDECFGHFKIGKSGMKRISDTILEHNRTLTPPDRIALRLRPGFLVWFLVNWTIASQYVGNEIGFASVTDGGIQDDVMGTDEVFDDAPEDDAIFDDISDWPYV
jgi:hypothetical protein